jgi:hypothetical protein
MKRDLTPAQKAAKRARRRMNETPEQREKRLAQMRAYNLAHKPGHAGAIQAWRDAHAGQPYPEPPYPMKHPAKPATTAPQRDWNNTGLPRRPEPHQRIIIKQSPDGFTAPRGSVSREAFEDLGMKWVTEHPIGPYVVVAEGWVKAEERRLAALPGLAPPGPVAGRRRLI